MKFFLIFPAFMILAAAVRVAGWLLSFGGWIVREPGATSVSLFQALRIGAIQGWAIAWPVLHPAVCVIVAVTLVCVAMLSVPVLAAWALRRQPPTVFLSYQSARTALALKLRALMQAQGITVRFVPFDPEVGHDQLLQRIVKALDGSQYMVCLPGERNSFVEDEVFAASYACKPIIFVVDHPDGQLPNTGAKKYPVLMTQALQEHEFAPLTELLRYLHGGWRETLDLYFLHNSPVDWVRRFTGIASGIVFACAGLLILALWVGGLTLFALEFFYSETFKVTGMIVLFAGGAVVFGLSLVLSALERLVNGVSGIIRRQRAVAAARYAVREGTFTDAVLREAFEQAGDNGKIFLRPAFLDALWQGPPDAHHEAARKGGADL